jgi:prepilin-type N-terminal cleavage/methylation domain-containing protein
MHKNKKQKGFTLIELLIVIAIIGILAAIAIPVFVSFQAKAKDAAANSAVGAFRTALELYRADNTTPPTGQYPADQAAINAATFDVKYISMDQIGASVTITYTSGDADNYSFDAVSMSGKEVTGIDATFPGTIFTTTSTP